MIPSYCQHLAMRVIGCERSMRRINFIVRSLGLAHTFLCTFSFLKISVASSRCWFSKILFTSALLAESVRKAILHVLLGVPCQQRQIQDKREPVSVNEEEESQESVYGSFGDDVGVEAVAEVDRVDVVTGA
jgi:hypothetical protein